MNGMNLGVQGLGGLQHVQQLRVVNLQQHPGDFSSQVWVEGADQRVQPLACGWSQTGN